MTGGEVLSPGRPGAVMLQGLRDSTPRDSQGPACVPRARQPWANRGDGAQPHPSRRLHEGAVQTEEAPEQRGPGNRGGLSGRKGVGVHLDRGPEVLAARPGGDTRGRTQRPALRLTRGVRPDAHAP